MTTRRRKKPTEMSGKELLAYAAKRRQLLDSPRTLDGTIWAAVRRKLAPLLGRYSIHETARRLMTTPRRVRGWAIKLGIPLPTTRPFSRATKTPIEPRYEGATKAHAIVDDRPAESKPVVPAAASQRPQDAVVKPAPPPAAPTLTNKSSSVTSDGPPARNITGEILDSVRAQFQEGQRQRFAEFERRKFEREFYRR